MDMLITCNRCVWTILAALMDAIARLESTWHAAVLGSVDRRSFFRQPHNLASSSLLSSGISSCLEYLSPPKYTSPNVIIDRISYNDAGNSWLGLSLKPAERGRNFILDPNEAL